MNSVKKMIKRGLIIMVSISVLGIVTIYGSTDIKETEGKTKPYVAGDAVMYNGNLVIATGDAGKMEIFALRSEGLKKTISLSAGSLATGNENMKYYDVALNQENGRLYAYAVDGKYFYKYDITNINYPTLVKKQTDTAYDWFMGVDKYNDRLVTIGTKGIKIWNTDMLTVDGYKFTNNYHNNLKFSDKGSFIFNVDGDTLTVLDTRTRNTILTYKITANDAHNHRVFDSAKDSKVYVVDDKYLRVLNFNGTQAASFKHTSSYGYDVDGLQNKSYVYFTDGIGIVKIDKATMKPLKWAYTTNLGASNGWAMGLKVLEDDSSEKIVVFNGSSILVFNDKLAKIASYAADNEDLGPYEKLSLKIDKNRAPVNAIISVHGTGYMPNEDVEVTFVKTKTVVRADGSGRFSLRLTVPEVLQKTSADIKAVGKTSGLSYSLGFNIEK